MYAEGMYIMYTYLYIYVPLARVRNYLDYSRQHWGLIRHSHGFLWASSVALRKWVYWRTILTPVAIKWDLSHPSSCHVGCFDCHSRYCVMNLGNTWYQHDMDFSQTCFSCCWRHLCSGWKIGAKPLL